MALFPCDRAPCKRHPFRFQDLLLNSCVALLAFSAPTMALSTVLSMSTSNRMVARIPRKVWRQAALHHQEKVKELLLPALLPEENYKSIQQQQRRQRNNIIQKQARIIQSSAAAAAASQSQSQKPQDNKGQQQQEKQPNNDNLYHFQDESWIRPLDPKNPICNFLIEYYGLKGHKGVKRLARWSPSPNLLLRSAQTYTSLEEFQKASIVTTGASTDTPLDRPAEGVFLEDVTEEDLATLLHLRGAILESDGALYSPSLWFDAKRESQQQPSASAGNGTSIARKHPASAFLWFRAILQQTLQAEPILHCHGLHEWAMQYKPAGAPPPPSGKYQNHLKLRVNQEVINEAVERKGISCTHVDALRFFAPAAGPLNHHGSSLERTDQLRLEQPACVHAHMDLLKMGLRLQPFCDADLMRRVLQISMDARRLDVAASPYDSTTYGVGIVPIETKEGRAQYRAEQRLLMERAKPIREELLEAFNVFLKLAFDEDPVVLESQVAPSDERYATAQPGGKPWRQNLVPSQSS